MIDRSVACYKTTYHLKRKQIAQKAKQHNWSVVKLSVSDNIPFLQKVIQVVFRYDVQITIILLI